MEEVIDVWFAPMSRCISRMVHATDAVLGRLSSSGSRIRRNGWRSWDGPAAPMRARNVDARQIMHQAPGLRIRLRNPRGVLEIDESYHRHYAVQCEVDRMGKIKDVVKLPLHLVRFNPVKSRYQKLEDLLRNLFADTHGAQNAAGLLVHFVGQR